MLSISPFLYNFSIKYVYTFAISSNIPKILIVTELRGFIGYLEKSCIFGFNKSFSELCESPSSRKVASKFENRHE